MVQTWPLARPLSVEETTCLLYSPGLRCLFAQAHTGNLLLVTEMPTAEGTAARTLQETARGDTEHRGDSVREDFSVETSGQGGSGQAAQTRQRLQWLLLQQPGLATASAAHAEQ